MLITSKTRVLPLLFALALTTIAAKAQYYYKDIVSTKQIIANYLLLRDNKVTHVTLNPAALDPAQNAVILQQTVYPSQKLVVTYTKVPYATESWLKSYYSDKGLLVKTVDSSAEVVTSSEYAYNEMGNITSISSNSVPVNDPPEKEVHTWTYNDKALPVKMLKIKNNTDTTQVSLTIDEQGSVAEEKAVHKKSSPVTYYYYYNEQRILTDIARFNNRANRILPDYMFEYKDNVFQPTQMIVVPEGSADYQTWKYSYNAKGLKEKDECYNKQKQMVASIEYVYTFGK